MSKREPIRYYDRYADRFETEQIYGEGFLRWAYETTPGRLALSAVVKRPFFSRWYGWRMDQPASANRIAAFIKEYGLDPGEFAEAPESFRSFNEFFFRKLRPEARPLDITPTSVVFPADGRHLATPRVSTTDGFYVKGQRFDLALLLGDTRLASRYRDGAMVISRLCPVDYHRFHFPCDGVPGPARIIDGSLFSVSPVALRRKLACLWQNKRALTEFQTASLGVVLILEVGATCVGGIVQTYCPGQPVSKGAEKGYFRFGGSCVIVIFPSNRVTLAADLRRHSGEGVELYAHVGDFMARACQDGERQSREEG